MTKQEHITMQIGAAQVELDAINENLADVKALTEKQQRAMCGGTLVLATDGLRLKRLIAYWKSL